MTDLFRSAFNYISTAANQAINAETSSGASGPKTDHPLVGTNVEIGGLKLRIRYLIAEGGFALVFAATDSQNRWYALKRLLAADKQAADTILLEIRYLRQLSGGPLVDALKRQSFSPSHVIRIMHSTCKAVRAMHKCEPPITHRDLKVENLLLDCLGCVKLCDFGSATTDTYRPDVSWAAVRRTLIEEEMAAHTTPMYRKLRSNFSDRLSEVPMPKFGRPPTLHAIFAMADNAAGWLRLNRENVVVIVGGEDQLCIACAALLLYSRVTSCAESAITLVLGKVPNLPDLTPGAKRYLGYVAKIIGNEAEIPKFERQPCADNTAHIALGASVKNDFSIALFHARSTLGGKVQGKLTSVPICRFSAHAAFIGGDGKLRGTLNFGLAELDELDADGDDATVKFSSDFCLSLEYRLSESNPTPDPLPPYWTYQAAPASPKLIVTDKSERDQIVGWLQPEIGAGKKAENVGKSGGDVGQKEGRKGFFETLEWGEGEGERDDPPPDESTNQNLGHKETDRFSPDHQGDSDADLLGLSADSPGVSSEPVKKAAAPKKLDSFDPFSEFSGKQTTENCDLDSKVQQDPVEDLFAHFGTEPTTNNIPSEGKENDLEGSPDGEAEQDNDLLGEWDAASIMQNQHASRLNVQTNSMHRNMSAPNFAESSAHGGGVRTGPNDPFADLMSGWGPEREHTGVRAPHVTPNLSAAQLLRPSSVQQTGSEAHSQGRVGVSRSGASTPVSQPQNSAFVPPQSQQQPSYNRVHFSNVAPNTGAGASARRVDPGAFDDLLGGFAPGGCKGKGPQTLSSLKKVEDNKDLDPVQIQMRDWTEGKERNIRSLLVSIHSVMWTEAAGKWQPIQMSELLQAAQVKKYYRKACLVVHPDKQIGTEQEYLAKAIFTELNDAWNEFESAGQPSLSHMSCHWHAANYHK